MLAGRYGWSLYEIDLTDIESLIPFVFRTATASGSPNKKTGTYCDQVDWL